MILGVIGILLLINVGDIRIITDVLMLVKAKSAEYMPNSCDFDKGKPAYDMLWYGYGFHISIVGTIRARRTGVVSVL